MGHITGIRQAAKRFKLISIIRGEGGSYSCTFIQKAYTEFIIFYVNHNYANPFLLILSLL